MKADVVALTARNACIPHENIYTSASSAEYQLKQAHPYKECDMSIRMLCGVWVVAGVAVTKEY